MTKWIQTAGSAASDLGLSFLATKEMKRTIAYSAAVIRTVTKILKLYLYV